MIDELATPFKNVRLCMPHPMLKPGYRSSVQVERVLKEPRLITLLITLLSRLPCLITHVPKSSYFHHKQPLRGHFGD